MLTYLRSGGPVMIPIIACSIIALATFLERMWSLRRQRAIPADFCIEVQDLLKRERFDDAETLCRTRPSPIGRVLEVAIAMHGAPRPVIKERIEEIGRREAAELERFVPILGTIASLGPLLGLLGTVGGMIVTFNAIDQHGLGDVAKLAGGIGQALITTFAGLVVAIPALVAHRWILARVDALVLELEMVATDMLDLLAADAENDA